MKNMKKWIAFIVALCTVISLCPPLSGTVSAAAYTFPDYYVEDLGVAIRDSMNMNNFFEIVTYNGNDYLVCPANGGIMFIYDLTAYINGTPNAKGNYIYAEVKSGISHPRGLVQVGSKVYSTGDASYVTWYDFASGTSGNITLPGTGYGIVADESGNLYVSGSSAVYRINAGATTASTIYETSRMTKILSIACYNSKLYIQGTLKKAYGTGSEVHEIGTQKSDNGSYLIPILNLGWSYKAKRTLTLTGVSASYYMSCANGMLFFGNVGNLVAVDTTAANMTRYYGKLNEDNTVSLVTALAEGDTQALSVLGILPVGTNGTSYAVINSKGLYTYDAANKSFAVKTLGGAKGRDLRCRDTYTVNGSEFIITGSTSTLNVWHLAGTNSFPVTLGGADGIFKDGYSEAAPRTMAPGVAGDDTVMYTGAYLSPSVSGYTPYGDGVKNAFSNGHAQTDSMLPYGDKLYLGCYSGAYLMEYDPATGVARDLIPGGLYEDESVSPKQLRIHALAAGDGMIFFSTIPDDQAMGGVVGCYNLEKESYTVFTHTDIGFDNHTIITLAYDEENNILYGGSSVRGGTATSELETGEGTLLAFRFDPADDSLTKLAGVTVGNLTPGDDTPRFIGGIAKDPYSNTFWGKVSQTLFTFKYENGQLTTTHQWSAPTYASSNTDRYSDSGSVSWFPRPILFNEDHLYVCMDQETYGLCQFDLNASRTAISNQTKIDVPSSRIYTMGTDGNIYLTDGFTINRVVISRTTMVEQLIDAYSAGTADMDTVISAYSSLTSAEQSRISNQHMVVIRNLLNADCYYYDSNSTRVTATLEAAMASAGSGNTVYLLDSYSGAVTVENGVVLDLNGKNVTGNVSVISGKLVDSAGGGTITGSVSVPNSNPYLPLLVPETSNTYRLFAYTPVKATQAKADDTVEGAVNFWFDLDFADPQAYTLLQGESNLKVGATLSWTEPTGVKSVEILFDDIVTDWAKADHSQNQGLYVQVTGIPYFGISNITVTPYFEAADVGMKITLDPISYDVTQFEAHAIFGAFPSGLTHK